MFPSVRDGSLGITLNLRILGERTCFLHVQAELCPAFALNGLQMPQGAEVQDVVFPVHPVNEGQVELSLPGPTFSGGSCRKTKIACSHYLVGTYFIYH